MSRKIYYSACSVMTPHIGVTIDDILSHNQEGNEIYWCYCHNALHSCFGNLNGYPSVCKFCHSMYKRYEKKYGNGIHVIAIDQQSFAHSSRIYNFDNIEQIKSIVYKDVYVGYAILSLYLTYTRDLDIKDPNRFSVFFAPIVDEVCDFVDYAYNGVNILCYG